MVEENDNLLKQIYYDPNHPAGFGGASALARASGIKLKDVEKWLKSQSTYSLHKPARRRYSTRHYRISGMNHLWQADLADMQPYANQNDGYRYILCVIDAFSRKASYLTGPGPDHSTCKAMKDWNLRAAPCRLILASETLSSIR